MKDRLRVLIADVEGNHLLSLRSQMEHLEHEVVAEAADGLAAVDLALRLQPDLVIMDVKLPGLDGIDAAKAMNAKRPVPVVLVTARSEKQLAERAVDAGIFAYLVKPVTESDLLPAIVLATALFDEVQLLKKGIEDLKEALEARKLVEQAKGILMERRSYSEQEAFRMMQLRSQHENKKLVEIAKAIIVADKML